MKAALPAQSTCSVEKYVLWSKTLGREPLPVLSPSAKTLPEKEKASCSVSKQHSAFDSVQADFGCTNKKEGGGAYTDKVPSVDAAGGALGLVHFCV